jgi:hypothetical protein
MVIAPLRAVAPHRKSIARWVEDSALIWLAQRSISAVGEFWGRNKRASLFLAGGDRLPLLARRGGRDIKKTSRSSFGEADGVVVQISTNLFDLEQPPRLWP